MSSVFFIAAVGCLAWALWCRSRIVQLEAQAEEKNRQKEAAIQLLDRIGESLTSDLEIEPALEIIADYIVEAVDAEAGAVFLVEGDGKHLRARVVRGLFPPLHDTSGYVLTKRKYLEEKVKADRLHMGEGIVGLVAQQGEPLLITDCEVDPRVPKVATDFLSMNSLIATPLRARGRTLGVFAVVNKRHGLAFNAKDLELLSALADQAAATVDLVGLIDEAAEKERLQQELRVAHEFQSMLLPERCPDIPGFKLAAYAAPALEVGGDFYDFIPLDDGRVGIVIADASGKGIPAALIMATARSTLRAEARGGDSPRLVLRRVNDRIIQDTKENVFLTMTYGILDFRRKTFRFSRAGHEPLLTIGPRQMEPRLHTPNGIAVGMVETSLFDMIEELEVQFADGETAVLYTDGATEAMDANDEEYGHQRLYRSICARTEESCEEMLDGVAQDIGDFSQGCPQHDDITLVAIQCVGPPNRESLEETLGNAAAEKT